MSKCLIIGIGNTLRGDDGIAAEVLNRVQETIDCNKIIGVTQLTIDLAPILNEYDHVLFIDAAVDLPPGQWNISEVPSGVEAASPFGHELTPAELVQLTRTLFRHCPAASLLRIGVLDLNTPDCISHILSENMAAYENCVHHWYRECLREHENQLLT